MQKKIKFTNNSTNKLTSLKQTMGISLKMNSDNEDDSLLPSAIR